MSGGGATGGHLETPTLDREAADLLRDISEHGGYVYAAMSGLAASGDVRAAEAAREMAWEQLHSGPWHSVLPVWRDAYSMACLHVARLHYRGGELKEALRVLDLGLIMGGTLLRKDLEVAVERLSVEARDARVVGGEEGLDKRLVRERIDQDKVLQILPIKSLSLKTVTKRSSLSLEGFLREFFLSGRPVVITDCMSQWPARTKWNDINYLKTVAGDRTVPVEL